MSDFIPKHLPLHGVRVLDITVVWAGPHCTQLLAEWGAEVIRIEPLSPVQNSTRGAEYTITREQSEKSRGGPLNLQMSYPDYDPGPRPWNRTPAFNSHARNKRSMTCNVATPEGRKIFHDLVAVSDVIVENNVPETVERAGFTYPDAAVANPGIIVLRMPAYGLNGPYKNYRSFGTHMEGMTGHHYLRSYPDLDPSMTGDAFTVDAASGVIGAFAVLAALRHRRRTGEGQQIELAQAENFLSYLGEIVLDYTMNGRSPAPQGNHHPSHAPHGVYPCAGEERWIAIDIATDAQWQQLRAQMGEPDWAMDHRYDSTLGRWRHREEMDVLIGAWSRNQDRDALFQALTERGVIAGPVQDERDLYACPHLRERGFFETLTSPEAGTHAYPGLVFRMSSTENHLYRYPVRLGEDNEYVYNQLLDIPPEQEAALRARGQISVDYPGRAPAPV